MSGWPLPLQPGENLDALQDKFARLWAEHGKELTGLQIAVECFPNDETLGRATQAHVQWTNSPKVVTLRNKYLREGAGEAHDRDKHLAMLQAIFSDLRENTANRLKAAEQIAKIKKYIDADAPPPNAGEGGHTLRIEGYPEDGGNADTANAAAA